MEDLLLVLVSPFIVTFFAKINTSPWILLSFLLHDAFSWIWVPGGMSLDVQGDRERITGTFP